MKYVVMMLLVFTTTVFAGGMIEQQLRDTPEMSVRCISKIDYYKNKIHEYELKLHLSVGQKLKLQYYKSELASWEDYCDYDNFGQ